MSARRHIAQARAAADTGRQLCEWFALCTNPATVRVAHPAIRAGVPTCQRCASRFGLEGAPLAPTA